NSMFIPLIYPLGIIAILVSFFVLYIFEYPILNLEGNVFISVTCDSNLAILFSPKLFWNDNLPVNADPILTAFRCICGNFTNADELHACKIPVSMLFIFNTSIQSINL